MIDISETKCIPPEPSGKPDEFERVAKREAWRAYGRRIGKDDESFAIGDVAIAAASADFVDAHQWAIDELSRAHRAVVAKLEAQLAEARTQVAELTEELSELLNDHGQYMLERERAYYQELIEKAKGGEG